MKSIILQIRATDFKFEVSTFTSNVQYLRTLQEVAEGGEVDFAHYLEHVGPQPSKGLKCTKPSKGFKCILCGKILAGNKAEGRWHVEAVHFPGTYEYECEFCGKKLNSEKQFSNHRSRCTKKPN